MAVKKIIKKTEDVVYTPVVEVIDTLEKACKKHGIEYREGVTRLLDLAKVLGVNYRDGDTLWQILEQVK